MALSSSIRQQARRGVLRLGFAACAFIACDAPPDAAGGPQCVVGEQVDCPCRGDVDGIQVCTADGTYAPCQCEPDPVETGFAFGPGLARTAVVGLMADERTLATACPDGTIAMGAEAGNWAQNRSPTYVLGLVRLVCRELLPQGLGLEFLAEPMRPAEFPNSATARCEADDVMVGFRYAPQYADGSGPLTSVALVCMTLETWLDPATVEMPYAVDHLAERVLFSEYCPRGHVLSTLVGSIHDSGIGGIQGICREVIIESIAEPDP